MSSDDKARGEIAWERMQALLDERRDPREALEGDAKTRAELTTLLQRLAVLQRSPRPSLAPRIAAAALVILIPLGVWSVLRGDEVPTVDPVALTPEPFVRVLDFRMTAETSSGGERLVTITTPDGVEQRREGGAEAPVIAFSWNRRSTQP